MGKKFEKGNTAAVGHGRPRLTDKERAVREALRSSIAEVTELLTLPLEQAQKILKEKDSSLLHQMFSQCYNKKDWTTIEKSFITRTLGASKQIIEQTNKDGTLEESMTKEQKIKALKDAAEELENE